MMMYDISPYDEPEEITCMEGRIMLTEQLTDELVGNVHRFSSSVCLLRDCYDVSPLFGKIILPAASTERRVDEHKTYEPAEDLY